MMMNRMKKWMSKQQAKEEKIKQRLCASTSNQSAARTLTPTGQLTACFHLTDVDLLSVKQVCRL